MVLLPHMHPFVLAVEPAQRHRQGNIDTASTAPKLPMLLTRVGHEYPDFVRTQDVAGALRER